MADHDITGLLHAWQDGNEQALEQLTPHVYGELHRAAQRCMRDERPGHILQTTALINELYLRLTRLKELDWQNRAHFYGVASQLMRRILVDHARSRSRAKRGGGAQMASLSDQPATAKEVTEVIALDDALKGLMEMDPRKSQIVEMKFFGGFTNEEVAEVLKVTSRTVEREWRKAKAWLHRSISKEVAE